MYLSQLESLGKPNEQIATSVADELLDFLGRDTLDLVTALPLQGIEVSAQKRTEGAITIRKPTGEELGMFMAEVMPPPIRPPRNQLAFWRGFSMPAAVLEIREPYPKGQQQPHSRMLQRVLLALQLLGFELGGAWPYTIWTEPGPTFGRGGGLVQLGKQGSSKPGAPSDLQSAAALAEKISSDVFHSPSKQMSVALHRFYLGCAETPADALIDFCVALEGLLLQQKDAELAFRFRLLGAFYLSPDDGDQRRELSNQLKEIYNARSTLVHGGTPSSSQELLDLSRRARGLAARALLKALDEGWPSPSALTDAVYK